MSDLGKPPHSAFWDFTLSIYRRDGVSPALISLQDRLGLDVNFLLFCLFAGARGHVLGDADFTRLEAAAAPLRQNLIHPLRQVRRWLKEQTLIGKESADAIRRAVLSQEIESEGLQQRAMEAQLTLPAGAADAAIAAGNLARYLAWSNVVAKPAEVEFLATALAQAFASSVESAKWSLHTAFAKTAAPQKFS
jgi:uncharacterized protein (TIGR02444 family)